MKAAIITLFGDNYGNKLQNYALQELLRSYGFDAETLLVKSGQKLHEIEGKKDILGKCSPLYLNSVLSSRLRYKYYYKNQKDGVLQSIRFAKTKEPNRLLEIRRSVFQRFTEENINIGKYTITPGDDNIEDIYDVYVCGSDQIWNPTYPSTSSAFFLQFAPEYKRIAYAPSFGLGELPETVKPLYRKWLNSIPLLSVREDRGADIIKSLTGRDVPVLPDPAMCLSAAEWENLEKRPDFDKKKYVLTYFLGNETNEYRHFIEKYATKYHFEIINLFDMKEPEFYSIDPAEFVWLVHHANAMFTDSFHGMVFSLIFHTPFVAFDRVENGGREMSSRIDTLLKMTGMEKRKYGSVPLDSIRCVNFADADLSIALHVKEARQFLEQALNAVKTHIDSSDLMKNRATQRPSKYVRLSKKDCNGCQACVSVCPLNCINTEVDKEGFSYPVIDQSRCVHCNKCLSVCRESEREYEKGNEKAYAAFAMDDKLRKHSSSGGIFSVIAEEIIKEGGSVYGAGFNEKYEVNHISINNRNEIMKLRGSKYVQSNIKNSYIEIKRKLDQGKLVYFSGTPCQVDGLLAYLDKEYDNLYTQDIICHGVPSPAVWKAYLQTRTDGELIQSVSFRDKTYGWHYFSMKIETEKRKYVKRLDEDVYTRLFLDNIILRPSCYACHHKHSHRKADFTLADCWGSINELNDDDRGISMVFTNSIKSQQLFNEIKDKLQLSEIPYD